MPKKFWKDIKQNLFFGKDQGTNQLITIKDSNGTTLTAGKDAASPLNMYYAQVGPSLATKFTPTWKPSSYLTSLMYLPKMRFRFVTIKELTSIVTCLATSKSSNVEDINTSQLKDAFKTMIIEFTFFINECLSKSVMPQKWKVGTVSPVPKNGNSHAMSDYRPISVLTTPSKIIERAVYNQLIYHFESHGLLDPRQHGFRRDHSTCSAIFELTQYLYNSMDSKLFVSCVFIDYSKAFDTIDHDILYNKLTYYGLDDGVLAWCKDYLRHRKQCVQIDHVRSGEETMKYGVPQGSILSPLFFIIYVNDLLKIIPQNIQILLYADDTVVYFADQDPNTACTNVENALAEIHAWCELNKLTINIKKTKHMLLAPRNMGISNVQHVKLGQVTLDNVTNYNYLGVIIDNLLIFNDFLKQKCDKINIRLYQLIKM